MTFKTAPQLRYGNIDLLAEVSMRWSPYNYCYSNPLRFTDPDGMVPEDNLNADPITFNTTAADNEDSRNSNDNEFKPDKNGNLIMLKSFLNSMVKE